MAAFAIPTFAEALSEEEKEDYLRVSNCINSGNVEVEYLDPVYDHIENPKLKTKELAEMIKEKMIAVM